jgi:hypothetical protein
LPEVDAMNDTGIIAAAITFVIVLFFCIWISFSARIISPGEILARAGIVAAVAAAIFAVIGVSHHRHVH